MMLLLGVDPGITAAGLALVDVGGERPRFVAAKRVGTDAALPIHERMHKVWRELARLILDHHPIALGIEEQSGAQVAAFRRQEFNVDNSKTMMVVGMACGAAFAYGLPIVWVKPQAAKIAVAGKGARGADKHQVKRAVAGMLLLREEDLTEAAADACAIAIAAGRMHRGNAWRATA